MAVHLIIIGYNPENRLGDAIPNNVVVDGRCNSPNCEIGSVFRVFEMPPAALSTLGSLRGSSLSVQDGSNFVLTEDVAPQIKPAETYVLEFVDRAAAVAFLESVTPRERLAGKLIVLIDPDTTRTRGASPASSNTLAAPAAPTQKSKSKDSKPAKEPKASKATKKAAKKATEPTKPVKPVKPKKAGK